MTTEKKHDRRKTILIQKEVQIGFLKFLLLFLIFCIISCTVSFVFFFKILIAENILSASTISAFFQENSLKTFIIFALPFIFSVPMLAYSFVRFTHRICGTIYNCHSRIKEILAGKENVKIKIRTGDYYQSFADDLNLMIQKINPKKSGDE